PLRIPRLPLVPATLPARLPVSRQGPRHKRAQRPPGSPLEPAGTFLGSCPASCLTVTGSATNAPRPQSFLLENLAIKADANFADLAVLVLTSNFVRKEIAVAVDVFPGVAKVDARQLSLGGIEHIRRDVRQRHSAPRGNRFRPPFAASAKDRDRQRARG